MPGFLSIIDLAMATTFNPYQAQLDLIAAQISENQALLTDPELKNLAIQEISQLEAQQTELLAASAAYEASSGQSDSEILETSTAKAIIEVRGGAGGDEAKIWAQDLLRMYLRFIEMIGMKAEYIDDDVIKVTGRAEFEWKNPESEAAEVEKIILYPFELFKYESGVHRVQRVPATEAQGRIHTSTASVAVLPEISAKQIEIKEDELEWHFTRAGGAGGQNVNKVNSAVELTHLPTGIVVKARQERKQTQNREIALQILRAKLWEIEDEKRLAAVGEARSAIGRNMRAEKIRTFNYPQNRVTDHRINESWYSLERIMEGELTNVLLLVRAKMSTNPDLITSTTETDEAED